MHRYLKLSDVVVQLDVDPEFLRALEAEDLIHVKRSSEGDLVISSADAERVRLARLLAAEMDVNLAGVEVIMHMRESMEAMHQQFCDILDALVQEMRTKLQR